MRTFFSVAIVLAGMACSACGADKMVFVDLERVFDGFYKTQLAKSRMEVQQKDIEAERQVMVDEMTAVNSEVDTLRKEARDVTLTAEIREGKRLLYEQRLIELRSKQKEIEEFTARRQQQLQVQVTRMSQSIMDEIRQTVVDYAKKEGLQAVIDNSSRRAAVGVFIYTHPDVEITEMILTTLNSRQPDVLKEQLFEDGATEGM